MRDASPLRDGGPVDAQGVEAGGGAGDGGRDAGADASTPGRDDGGASDAGRGSGCSGATLFCEDFETVALGDAAANARWEPTRVNASLTIEEGRARGERSLHVRAMGNQCLDHDIVIGQFLKLRSSVHKHHRHA